MLQTTGGHNISPNATSSIRILEDIGMHRKRIIFESGNIRFPFQICIRRFKVIW